MLRDAPTSASRPALDDVTASFSVTAAASRTTALLTRPVAVPRPPRARRLPRLPEGWPLTALFVGFPLWWVLGISAFAGILAAVLMAAVLVRRRVVLVPKGFGLWMILLAWVVVGVFLLQVDAPGAVPDSSSGRYVTWAYRLAWYLSATVALLYVGNLRKELSSERITRALSWMFLTTAAGGWLGILMPHLQFRSALELALPKGLAANAFVQLLVHPTVVQQYAGAATDTARPSAPFAYSNIWGLNFACFLPFFVYAWFGPAAGRRRLIAPFLLAWAIVPAVQSLNRGLWIALVLSALIFGVRSAMSGKIRYLVVGAIGVTLLGLVLAASPLGSLISTRLDNPTSNDTRASLGLATVTSVLEGSPAVGFGTTRDVQGSFSSIAGGATADCPLCSPPALGTQGHLWLVIFSQGVVGLVLYLSFYLYYLARGWRVRSGLATVGIVTISAHLVTMFVYDSIGTSMLAVMIGVGLIWRETHGVGPDAMDSREAQRTFGAYVGFLRRHVALLLVTALVGGMVGAAWQSTREDLVDATISVVLPDEPPALLGTQVRMTMDTEGALALDGAVLTAMSKAINRPVSPDDIFISADPNTRVLNIRYAGHSAAAATTAVNTAATALLSQRSARITTKRDQTVAVLTARANALDQVYDGYVTTLAALDKLDTRNIQSDYSRLRETRNHLVDEIGQLNARVGTLQSQTLQIGSVVTPASAKTSHDPWIVSLLSGVMLGFLAGVALAYTREMWGHRLGRGRRVYATTGLHLLSSTAEGAHAVLRTRPDSLVVAGDDSDTSLALTRHLQAVAAGGVSVRRHPARPPGVVIVASPRMRTRSLATMAERLTGCGQEVAGVVLTNAPSSSRLLTRLTRPRNTLAMRLGVPTLGRRTRTQSEV